MLVDSHVHLQPHGQKPPMTIGRIERYVASAFANGVQQLAITEHLFRFQEAYDLLYGWWEADASHPALVRATRAYWEDHVSGTVSDYVRTVERAKSAGLPVLLGLELDWVSGRADALRRFLAPYDWDVVLGSVHWIGSWGFDNLDHPVFSPEWDRRDIDAVFSDYAAQLRDLAGSRLCDVLAHPDLPKLSGRRPSSLEPLDTAIIDAARDGSCAVEVNSNGYNQPASEPYPALSALERACASGLPITLASDAHVPERVGQRFDDIAGWAATAGYRQFVSFEGRRATAHRLSPASATQEKER